jgi:LPXTG-motif cell wall-anchored protein
MRMTNRLLCLLIALMLVVPAAAVPAIALGQSAGDDQYVDPFQDDQTGKNQGSGSGGGNNSDSNNSGSEQTTGQSNTGDTAGTTAAQNSADDSSNNNKLPHTGSGLPEGWLVAIGVLLLLGGGFVLRRVWPRPD